MCRIEERVYVSADGKRSMFEERFPCDKARHGKLCAKVKKKTSEYHIKSGSFPGDNTPTPTGAGTYLVQQRRPSSNGGRPSTRDGQKTIAPDIIINFNSKKDSGKRYSGVTVSTKAHKRPSLMASPIGLNDLIDDSPASDASHTIRTGFPDAPLPAPTVSGHPESYMPSVSHGYHYRQTSSVSSFNASSQPPSLCVTSDLDYESPDSRRSARPSPKIVQDQSTIMQPPSPSRVSALESSVPHRKPIVTPRDSTHEIHSPEGRYPVDHGDLVGRSASSHASSRLPDSTRKSKLRDDRRKREEVDDRTREDRDALSRQVVEELARDNAKQVRFELDRPLVRGRERAEKFYAEKERDRIQAARDSTRRLERKEREKREREEAEAKLRKKDKSKASPTKLGVSPVNRAQRPSMTQDQLVEQRRLLAAEEHRMQNEREVAEARDREEQHSLLRPQQDAREYFDPRGGDRSLGRRASISQQPLALPPMPSMPPSRSNSHRRTSISTQTGQDLSTRPTAIRQKTGPPISFPSNFNQSHGSSPCTRRQSFSQPEVPQSARKRRDSGSSTVNPFVQDSPPFLSQSP